MVIGGQRAVPDQERMLKEAKFSERAETSASARQAMLERFRARPPADDPAVLARAEERRRVQEARDARTLEKEALRRAEEARKEAERIAAEIAERERREMEELEKIERLAELETAQKAARDARYAARKAAKRRK